MLSRLVITLEKSPDKRLNYNISSLFHGILMEHIDFAYADMLHETGLKPYSHYLEFNKDSIKWNIQTISEEAKRHIINPLIDECFNTIYVKHKDLNIKITDKILTDITYRQLIDEKYFKDSSRFFNIRFLTPCSFKSRGRYVFHPTLSLIYQSLMNKFDTGAADFTLKSEEVLEQLETYSEIVGYNLKSTRFHLEGVSIPAFVGGIGIKVNGPQPMVNLVNLMLSFGEYSGIGIKCALGMGGVRLVL